MAELKRQHKLVMQSVALALIIGLPVPMHYAAGAGSDLWVYILGVGVAAGMVLAAWIG